MSNKLYEENDIQNIANAIRNKNGTEDTYKVSQMSTAINSIEVIEQATAEGESLSLANTKAMPYSDYVVEGKSEQDGEPSPSNPSEIHSVADDVNLFDVSKIANSSISVTDNGKTIIMPLITSGNGNTNTATKLNVLCPDLQVGDVIYIRFKRNLNNNRNKFIYLYGSNRLLNASENSPSYTITQEDLNSYVFLYGNDYDYGETEQCIITDFKIQKNTVPINYSPYNQGTITIKQRGKNENDGINYDFYIGAEATTYRKSIGDNGICIPIRNQNYTISTKEVQARYRVACSNSLPSNTSQNCFNGVVKDGTNDNVTIDTSGYKYLLVNCTNINDIQIEQGTQATTYEPYQANDYTIQTEPLRSLPNGVKDTMELQDMQNHTRIGRQTGTLSQTTTITLSDAKQNGAYMCNIKSAGTLTGQTIELEAGDYEIIYELANEVIEPLTQNQATTMLDIIQTGSYEGTTNIYTDEDVKPTMKVDYYKKA